MYKYEKILKDIKELKIQGARNVARAALEALTLEIAESKEKDKEKMLSDILVAIDNFSSLRATEPMLENLLKMMLKKIENAKDTSEIRMLWKKNVEIFKEKMASNFEKIVGYGANLIKDGSTILTHCHSSTVEGIIKRASEIKDISVFCTETRPLFQGRITAKNLSRAGVDVTMIVDSAVGYFIKDIDIVLVGADVVTSRGTLINKIGTSTIAMLAYENKVPFYSACELWKFDQSTRWGIERKIEERTISELLKDLRGKEKKEFEKIKILNPSFDATDDRYINGYITEEGVISPQDIARIAEKSLL